MLSTSLAGKAARSKSTSAISCGGTTLAVPQSSAFRPLRRSRLDRRDRPKAGSLAFGKGYVGAPTSAGRSEDLPMFLDPSPGMRREPAPLPKACLCQSPAPAFGGPWRPVTQPAPPGQARTPLREGSQFWPFPTRDLSTDPDRAWGSCLRSGTGPAW